MAPTYPLPLYSFDQIYTLLLLMLWFWGLNTNAIQEYI